VEHEDGIKETINLRHSLNQNQIEWFKAGSAMNYMKKLEEAGVKGLVSLPSGWGKVQDGLSILSHMGRGGPNYRGATRRPLLL
jgi:hypothetical protein